MALHLGAGALASFEHLLDQVDAAARAVALIAQQHVGRAGGGAEATMYAAAQDLVCLPEARVFKLAGCEMRLHGVRLSSDIRIHAAGVEDAGRVEGRLEAARDRFEAGLQRRETSTPR